MHSHKLRFQVAQNFIYVLILVLMEDALAHNNKITRRKMRNSLNPCFNGRCTRTFLRHETCQWKPYWVLILVLMEDALAREVMETITRKVTRLNPCFNGRCTRTQRFRLPEIILYNSLNPCFNGRCTRTEQFHSYRVYLQGLNPCFNGRCTRTKQNLN